MAEVLNEHALAFRDLSRDEAIGRYRTSADALMDIFENLTEEEWGGFMVPHVFAGPLPAFLYPAFQIMDYGVHSWDMRWGLGDKETPLEERTAGVLLPYMFGLWQGTVNQEAAKGVDITYGIAVDGEWGGQWKATVQNGQFGAHRTGWQVPWQISSPCGQTSFRA